MSKSKSKSKPASKPKLVRKVTLKAVIQQRDTALSECNRFKQMCCDLECKVNRFKEDLGVARYRLEVESRTFEDLHRKISDLEKELEARLHDEETRARIEAILPRVEAFEKALAEGKTASDAILADARAEADRVRRVDSHELANLKAQLIRNRSSVLGVIALLQAKQPVDTTTIIGELQKMTW